MKGSGRKAVEVTRTGPSPKVVERLSISDDLVGVVRETIQPAQVSLRSPAGVGRDGQGG